ncbi:MAG TPA: molybdenum cofactor biosynthesis protein MoaE [Janthinobacterium sp.]|nr:molybdenum cofactor biosynthesis protein MoaE [Janthinobacterium sp.]
MSGAAAPGAAAPDAAACLRKVRVQAGDFDLSHEVAQLRAANPKVGAVVTFVGAVRDLNEGAAVSGMELEHYPGMTEQSIAAIVAQAMQRWALFDALVIHRVGPLKPMEQIVLVAATAAHRGEAFAGCEFIIDYLKTEAPFWKKEQTPQGARWVDARVTDESALAKWR